MKQKNKEKIRKRNMFYKIISFIFIILNVITFSFAIYIDILPLSMLFIGGLIYLLLVVSIVLLFNSRLRLILKRILLLISLIIMIFEIIFLIYGSNTLDFIKNITDNGSRIDEYGIYVLKNSGLDKLSDLEDKDIGYLSSGYDKISSVINKIEESIDINALEEDNLNELVDKLVNGYYDAIIMEISNEDIIKEEQEENVEKIKKIDSIKIETKIDTLKSSKDITKDAFLIYVSGIDTTGSVQNKARSDVNLIIGVNPKTKNILLISTPRDYYVLLHSKGKKDKLTHSGIYGVEESLLTLSDLYDEKIDYYARVNFTSFVSIVDALGGIEVDVPINFCEQNSKREHGEKEICLKKGKQKLNGEQALALARHRHSFATGDRARGENQMMILEAIINKAMSPNVITKYNSLLNALDNKVSTNMTSEEMIKFVKKQIKRTSGWKFTKLSANGMDSKGVCYSSGSSVAYVMEPDEETVDKIKTTIDLLMNGSDELVET